MSNQINIGDALSGAIGLKHRERENYQGEIMDLKEQIEQLKNDISKEKSQKKELDELLTERTRAQAQRMNKEILEDVNQLARIVEGEGENKAVDMLLLADPSFDLITVVREKARYQDQNVQLKQHIFELKTKLAQLQDQQLGKEGTPKEQRTAQGRQQPNDYEQEQHVAVTKRSVQ